jgi:hypothetical protein
MSQINPTTFPTVQWAMNMIRTKEGTKQSNRKEK